MDLQLKGKTALVTGSSRGLGFAVALALAQEGANLTVNSRHHEDALEAAHRIRTATGVNVLALAANVTDHSAAESLISQTVSYFGGLDILITNAGGPPAGSFESFDDNTWQNAVEASLLSHVRLIRAALPYLRKSSAASVLTLTSYSVKQPIPNLILSNSIRSATASLTKSLAAELGPQGIRFNSILPGWTETEQSHRLDATSRRCERHNRCRGNPKTSQ